MGGTVSVPERLRCPSDNNKICEPKRAVVTKAVGSLSQFPKGGVDSNASVLALPRGGVLVRHSGGSVQFGIPPETIKDSLTLGIGVPTTFVILGEEMFDRDLGINVAEIEFPAYFNFFVNQKKVTIITVKSVEARVRTIFQETLLGPKESDYDISEDFHPSLPGGVLSKTNLNTCWPDFTKEGLALDKNREFLTVDRLFDFRLLDEVGDGKERGRIVLDAEHSVVLKYNSATKKFTVREKNKNIAQVDSKFLRPRSFLKLYFTPHVFTVPRFGVTMLGSSHGFDPAGTTTGFIVWVNYRGIVVDPPAQSPELLQGMGIHSRLIDGMILTHCHADHDAGAFQKILLEEPINVYTTRTIMNSFIRKYSAVSGFDSMFLRELFHFQPVVIGECKYIHGGRWDFFYALHVIPTIGFEVKFEGEGVVYSGDTRTEDSLFNTMKRERAIGTGRYNHLTKGSPFRRATFSTMSIADQNSDQESLSTPEPSQPSFTSSGSLSETGSTKARKYRPYILHEAGVPPIHTPLEILANLDKEIRERLYVVHTNEAQVKKNYPGTLQVASEWSTIHISTTVECQQQLELRKESKKGLKVSAEDGANNSNDDAVSETCDESLGGIESKLEILQLINLLSTTPLFEQLVGANEKDLDKAAQLVQLGKLAKYPKGSVIARKGDTWDRCIVIRAGVAEEQSGTLNPHLLVDEDEITPPTSPSSPASYKAKPSSKPYEHMSEHKRHFVGEVLGELSLVSLSEYFRNLNSNRSTSSNTKNTEDLESNRSNTSTHTSRQTSAEEKFDAEGSEMHFENETGTENEQKNIMNEQNVDLDDDDDSQRTRKQEDLNTDDDDDLESKETEQQVVCNNAINKGEQEESNKCVEPSPIKDSDKPRPDEKAEVSNHTEEGKTSPISTKQRRSRNSLDLTAAIIDPPSCTLKHARVSVKGMNSLRLVRHDVIAVEDVYAIEFTPEAIKPFFGENDMGEVVLKGVVKLAKCRNRESWEVFRFNRMISHHTTLLQKQKLQLILSEPTPVSPGTVLRKVNTLQDCAWLIAEGKVVLESEPANIASQVIRVDAEKPDAGKQNLDAEKADAGKQKLAAATSTTPSVFQSSVSNKFPGNNKQSRLPANDTISAGKGSIVCDVNALLRDEVSNYSVTVRSKHTVVYPIPKEKLLKFINQFPGIKVLWLDCHVVR